MPIDADVLFTGGSGLLGRAVSALRPDFIYPSSSEMDIAEYEAICKFCNDKPIKTLVHAAAFTSPPKIDNDPLKALNVNISGTTNIVRYCMHKNIRLIYISTDYVFRGDTGNYTENDPVYPVNLYAWSKLGGECAVRLYANTLIVRTSFGQEPFPYDKGFTDQWTSRQGVSQIASKLVQLIDTDMTGIVHVGGERRTVYEYAVSVAAGKQIGKLSIRDIAFTVPVDTSLDCSRYRAALEHQNRQETITRASNSEVEQG